MSATAMNDRTAAADVAAARPEGDDVRVPVECDEDVREPEADATVDEKDAEVEEQSAAADARTQADEEAMVAEAIRRGEQAAADDLKADADALRDERDDLARKLADAEQAAEDAKSQAADAADRLARLQADWENYRRRTAGERLAERELACEKLVGNLLPVIDDMERAVAHANSTNDGDENLKQFVDGVSAVRAKMLDVLAQEGVELIDPAGQPFEPMCHQAVGRVEDADEYDETVRDVYQFGYRMGKKVIRPAMVTVTFGGARRPVEADPAEKDAEPEADKA